MVVRSGEIADRLSERTSWAALAAALVVTVAPIVASAQTPSAAPTETTPIAALPPATTDMVLLEADTLTDDQTTRTITAEGNVEVRYQGRTMRADRLVYDLNPRPSTLSAMSRSSATTAR